MKFFFCCFFIAVFFSAQAQEIISELKYNAVLQAASKQYHPKFRSLDTLNLPFTDDFSNAKVYPYPDPKLWADKNVYVNTTYPVNPISIGVATFDGLDEHGMPYDTSGGVSAGDADTLTSLPMHLQSLLPADSVYLSFYYEAQGYGDYPNPGDLLTLQLKKNDGTWKRVWFVDGFASSTPIANQHFRQVMIPIDSPAYFYDGFQFRFHNIATLSGNNDHWHIDYVRLDKNRFLADTVLNDVAMASIPTTLLKNYEVMPWLQFKDFQSTELAVFNNVAARNNFTVTKNVPHNFRAIENYSGTVLKISATNSFNFPALSSITKQDSTFIISGDPSKDSASVSITYVLNTTSDFNTRNDSAIRTQNFFNYYAFDDGSAEKAYGLQGTGSKLAVKFHLNQPDTLRAIQIHFAHIDANVSEKLFSLMVWKSLTPETIIYEQDFQKPTYIDSINGFYTYLLDTPQAISETFYIGWLQTYPDLLNVGFDRNTDSHQNLSFNVTGAWETSSYAGSVMMRPVIGNKIPFLSVSTLNPSPTISIYPNPVENILAVSFNENVKCSFKIFDCTGRTLLQSSELTQIIDVSKLTGGIYFLQVQDKHSGKISVGKFIKL